MTTLGCKTVDNPFGLAFAIPNPPAGPSSSHAALRRQLGHCRTDSNSGRQPVSSGGCPRPFLAAEYPWQHREPSHFGRPYQDNSGHVNALRKSTILANRVPKPLELSIWCLPDQLIGPTN